ncbi:Cytochrome P450 monooxygenase FSL4 [Metarhizium brunneum]|uniref:Cytochrome P450 monooxygenase FSL4 n=1 Tax=Metarhizium brunneum TaxID=500148 RepID=A0A7D5UUM4_9HYPO
MFGALGAPSRFLVYNVAIPFLLTKYLSVGIFGSRIMTMMMWLTVLCILRVFYSIFLYPEYFSRFRHIPTPKERSWLWGNCPPHFAEPIGMTLRRINETVPNDGVIRVYDFLCQERLLLTEPKAFGEVLVQNPYVFTKTFQLKYNVSRLIGEGLACSEGEEHRRQRKHLMPAFSYRHIKELYPSIWLKAAELVSCLDKEITGPDGKPNNKVINMKDWASRVTLDIIGVTGMGCDFQSLRNPDNDLALAYSNLFLPLPKNFKYFAQIDNFISPRIISRLPSEYNDILTANSQYVRRITTGIIEKKRLQLRSQPEVKSVDIISQVLRSDDAFSNDNMVDQVMSFLAAGHETTSTSFQWVMLALSRHPHVQERLRAEIHAGLPVSCFPDQDQGSQGATTPTAAMIDALPYLKAVCSEVLRCFPPAPQTLRVSDYADGYIQGEFIPRGTNLLIAPQAVNYDPKLWGPDAGDFNPDRWMAPGQANSGGAASPYALMTFSQGPHGCIAGGFARAELAILTAAFVGSFRFKLEDPDYKIEYDQSVTISPSGGIRIYLEKCLPLDSQ